MRIRRGENDYTTKGFDLLILYPDRCRCPLLRIINFPLISLAVLWNVTVPNSPESRHGLLL